MKIQYVTAANYGKYGERFLKITKKYRDMLDEIRNKGKKSKAVEDLDEGFKEWYAEQNVSGGGKKRKRAASGGRGRKRLVLSEFF